MLKWLRFKFVVINMSIVSILLCLVFGTVLHFTKQNLERSSISMMQTMLPGNIAPGRPDMPPEEIRLPFFILNQMGQDSFTAFGGGYFDLSDEELLRQLWQISSLSPEPIGIIEDYNLRYMRITGPDGARVVFSDISSEISTMKNLRRDCLLIGIGSFFAFLAVSILLARWAVKPVDKAWKQQRQFVADASHELKTPLTVIVSNAELLQDEGFDENAKQGFSQSILTMSRHMRHLVEDLLELARLDSPVSKPALSSIDLSSAVLEALLPFEALFYEKDLRFSYEVEEKLSLKADRAKMKQLVDILLDNAQKYSYPNTEVSLSLKKENRHIMLKVSSHGDQISAEDLNNIFKRFWRKDEARSRSGSFGLGLSIAESIVIEHKGKIWAESENGINSFFVQL